MFRPQATRMRALTDAALACAAARLAATRHRDAGLVTDRTVRGQGLRRVTLVDGVALYDMNPTAAVACPA